MGVSDVLKFFETMNHKVCIVVCVGSVGLCVYMWVERCMCGSVSYEPPPGMGSLFSSNLHRSLTSLEFPRGGSCLKEPLAEYQQQTSAAVEERGRC